MFCTLHTCAVNAVACLGKKRSDDWVCFFDIANNGLEQLLNHHVLQTPRQEQVPTSLGGVRGEGECAGERRSALDGDAVAGVHRGRSAGYKAQRQLERVERDGIGGAHQSDDGVDGTDNGRNVQPQLPASAGVRREEELLVAQIG